jgi:hypothetical protein
MHRIYDPLGDSVEIIASATDQDRHEFVATVSTDDISSSKRRG